MKTPIRIIHLEVLQADAKMIEKALKESGLAYNYLWVSDKKNFQNALDGFSPDLVLGDLKLPSLNAARALGMIKQSGRHIPFILVTDVIFERSALNMTGKGVEDYVLKDRLQRLPLAVKNALSKAEGEKLRKGDQSRKTGEQRLRKSEANLRTIFDSTEIAYVFVNTDNKVVSFNQRAINVYKKELGINIKEGESLQDYSITERSEISRIRFEAVLQGAKIIYEAVFTHGESAAWYTVSMLPVRDTSDAVIGFVISSEEITTRKVIELEKVKMTAEILRHNKDLEQFTYIVSHNLRSSVANILALTRLLDNSPESPPGNFKRYLDGITLSATKLDEIINDLNAILQTRQGANEKKEIVSFHGLVEGIKIIISELAHDNCIIIKTDFMVEEIFTVKSYLHSIFINLVTNSIKYHKPGFDTEIFIHAQKLNNTLIIRYSDNGLGIDLDLYGDQLFGLYKRFHNHVEGKGMGLYLVKTQLEILGASISVSSQVNKGTEFLMTFAL